MEQEQTKAPKIIEAPPLDPTAGFDNRVHIKDAKTGRLIRIQEFTTHKHGQKTMFERPTGSQNMFAENGEAIGRWDVSDPSNWKKIGPDHIKTKAPPVNKEEALEQRVEGLQAELEALKAEASARLNQKPQTQGQQR